MGKFDTQTELNELCRVHESLKVKYTNTLYDSRCILFNGSRTRQVDTQNGEAAGDLSSLTSTSSGVPSSLDSSTGGGGSETKSSSSNESKEDTPFTTPSNFKSQAYFYAENDSCEDLEANIIEFLSALFWILESKRLEKSREKIDKVVLLQAPFEKKDFVGLDLDTRNNRKRCTSRFTKNLGDLTLQAGLVADSLQLFHTASETFRAISDSLWLAAANEGLCAASAILLYPNIRNSSTIAEAATASTTSQPLSIEKSTIPQPCPDDEISAAAAAADTASSSPTTSESSALSSSAATSSTSSAFKPTTITNNSDNSTVPSYPSNIIPPDEIAVRYRDAIINYSKYRHAGIIETEAALKAARICIEQRQNLDVAMFLQNILYINLNMTEQERVIRFETLTQLYQQIGYHRKAAFCQRLAAWRHVAQSNSAPDWSQSYRLMLASFSGHRLSLDPIEVLRANCGWPCLQIDLLQQLVGAARRLGHSALATRHMTFLLQTMWRHMTATEQREMAMQLQTLSAQCEGAPVALVLESGTVIPPSNLTDLPVCDLFQVRDLAAHLRPHKIIADKVESSPFLFTPIHFTSSIERKAKKNDSKIGMLYGIILVTI